MMETRRAASLKKTKRMSMMMKMRVATGVWRNTTGVINSNSVASKSNQLID